VIVYWPERPLSAKAMDLVEFDMASIRLLTHGVEPSIWVVSTEQYELNGRVLRDSTSPRLLAYYPDTKATYVTDGCNTCTHDVADVRPELLAEFQKYL
jgi:hypothetical protein